jgi:hypothetical protein
VEVASHQAEMDGAVGEQSCLRGPAQALAMSGLRRGVWGRFIRLPDSRKGAARRGQVGRDRPSVLCGESRGQLRRSARSGGRTARSQKPRIARRDPKSLTRRSTGWTEGPASQLFARWVESGLPAAGGAAPMDAFARAGTGGTGLLSAAGGDRRQQEGRKDRDGAQRQHDAKGCNPSRTRHHVSPQALEPLCVNHRARQMWRRYSK